jgi:hypothetical protein
VFYLVVRRSRELRLKHLLLFPPLTFAFCLIAGFRAGYLFVFPVGGALVLLNEPIQRLLVRHRMSAVIAACLGLAAVVTGRLLWFSTLPQRSFDSRFAEIAIDLINLTARNVSSVAFSLSAVALVGLVGMAGFSSGFASWCGSISYELFLLHGLFSFGTTRSLPLFLAA